MVEQVSTEKALYPFATRPYFYQLEALRKLWRQRWGGALLLEPGTGKSKIAIDFSCALYLYRGIKRVLVVCPIAAFGVWSRELGKHVPEAQVPFTVTILNKSDSVEKIYSEEPDPHALRFIIVNYESAWRILPYLLRWKPQVTILDECLHPQARILTEQGYLPIKEIVERKMKLKVWSLNPEGYFELKPILNWFKKPLLGPLLRTGSLVSTGNHRFLTSRGYVRASELSSKDQVLRIDFDLVSNSPSHEVKSEALRVVPNKRGKEKRGSVLLPPLFQQVEVLTARHSGEVERSCFSGRYTPSRGSPPGVSGAYAQKQPHEKSSYSGKDGGFNENSSFPEPYYQRGEWETTTTPSKYASTRARLGPRGCCEFGPKKTRVPHSLYTRHSQLRAEGWDRGGRIHSPDPSPEAARPKETGLPGVSWVDYSEIQEQASAREPREYSPTDSVYDLEVGDNHNYIAEGLLVSNSHQVKRGTTKKARACHKLGKVSPYRLILTGTPITNSPLDLFSQWKFLNLSRFGSSFMTFAQQYAVYGGYGGHQVLMYKNLDGLQRLIAIDAFIAKKEDCLDLPEKVFEVVPIELQPKTRNLYEQMKKEMIAELESGEIVTAEIVLTKLLRLEQISSGFTVYGEDGHREVKAIGREKLDTLADLLDTHCLEAQEKVVVFCRFIASTDRVSALLKKMEIPYHLIRGDVDYKERDEIIQWMWQGPGPKVLVAQIATASLSIDLSCCHTAIFYELDHSLDHFIQAQDRLHRLGQVHKVLYLNLLPQDTVDEGIYEALREKKDIAERVVSNLGLKVKVVHGKQ